MKLKIFFSILLITFIPMVSFAHTFDLIYNDGSSKSCNYNELSGELFVDHVLNKPVKEIKTNIEKKYIKKINFSFVYLDNLCEEFWNCTNECEIIKMNYVTSSNLDFVKKIPNLRVLSLIESNKIKSVTELDFSSNNKLEYIELEGLTINIENKVILPEGVKYFVICYSNINKNGYEKFAECISKDTVFIIDSSQEDLIKNPYLNAEKVLRTLWNEYNLY